MSGIWKNKNLRTVIHRTNHLSGVRKIQFNYIPDKKCPQNSIFWYIGHYSHVRKERWAINNVAADLVMRKVGKNTAATPLKEWQLRIPSKCLR